MNSQVRISLMLVLLAATHAVALAQPGLPFSQNWSNTNLITIHDDWSGVTGIIGYRGDNLTTTTGVDPQTIVATGDTTPVDVNANQTNPNTFTTGGVSEFEITDPVIALQGSGTADAPHIVISVNTTGFTGINVAYDLRDIDGSADNAVQPVALQYRVGSSGDFTNIPAGFVADASTGPNLATLVTPVSVILPSDAENVPLVQIRIITNNAVGSDEWIGIDNIFVTSGAVPIQLSSFTATVLPANAIRLNWTTISEVNNYGFVAQRRVSPTHAFEEVENSFIPGNGTTLVPHHYQFTDYDVLSVSPEYRLKQIDLDGTVHFTDPVHASVTHVEETVPAHFVLDQNFPNPFNPATRIRFSVSQSGRATLRVYNLIGREVATPFDATAETGRWYNITFDGSQLSSGTYIYKLESNNQTLARKFVLLK